MLLFPVNPTGVNDVKLTNTVNLAIDGVVMAVTLTPTAVPVSTGTKVFLLRFEFFQLINRVQYSLKMEHTMHYV